METKVQVLVEIAAIW